MPAPIIKWAMKWQPVSPELPKGEPILVCYDRVAVVALAFQGDYYYPDMTFMDARTFEILPIPTHWMPLPERPGTDTPVEEPAPRSRRAA